MSERKSTWQQGFGRIPGPPRRETTTAAPPEGQPEDVDPGPDGHGSPRAAAAAATSSRDTAGPRADRGLRVVTATAPATITAEPAGTEPSATEPVTGQAISAEPVGAAPAIGAPVSREPASGARVSPGGASPEPLAGPGEGGAVGPPVAAPLPRPAPPAAGNVQRTVTGAQVRASRAAARYASTATSSLAAAGVHVDAVEADLAAERLHLVLVPTVGTAEDVLDAADLIADALGVPDVNCSSDGTRVHVWAVVGTTTKTRQVAVWVPVAVRDAVNQIRADHGETVTTVVLSAFNRQAGEDGSGLAELFPGAAAAAPGPMSIVTRKKRANLDTPVQLWMYLHASQEVVLDQAVAATGAGSRSALITRILEADLNLPHSS